LNRQQRRAVARKRVRTPMVKLGLLTLHEAELMSEWADAYLLQQERDLPPPDERTPLEQWAVERTRQIQALLQAKVEDRPAYDEHREREEPSYDDDQTA
jgi:hypothetical protein